MLQITLLGRPRVLLDGKPVSPATAKADALLYYLAATSKRRAGKSCVICSGSEMVEARARRNLSTTLSNLRKELGSHLRVEPEQIALNSDATCQVDLLSFEKLIREGQSQGDFGALRQAVALYQGDFLAGVSVQSAFVFEEWLSATREGIRQQALEAMACVGGGRAGPGADYAYGIELDLRTIGFRPMA